MRLKSISTVFILTALICALIGCGGATAKERIATDRPWKALPAAVMGAGWVDVRGLMASAIGKDLGDSYLASQADMLEFDRFVEATGFDPAEDLDSVTIGFGELTDDGVAPVYLIASGRFDVDRLSAELMKEPPSPPREIEGLMAYSIKTSDSSDDSRVGWLNDKTMLFATARDFGDLVQSVRAPRDSNVSKALAGLMDGSDGQVFMALEVPESLRAEMREGAGGPGGNGLLAMMAPMSNLQSVLLSMDTVAGLDMTLKAVAGSAEDGQLLHDSLKGLMAMARMTSGGDPETLERLNQLKLSLDGPTLSLSIKMTEEQLASALDDVGVSEDE